MAVSGEVRSCRVRFGGVRFGAVWVDGSSHIKNLPDEGSFTGVLFCLYKICTVTFQTLKIFIKNNQTSSKSLQPNLSKISDRCL